MTAFSLKHLFYLHLNADTSIRSTLPPQYRHHGSNGLSAADQANHCCTLKYAQAIELGRQVYALAAFNC
jgi:hypothetical protein